MPLSIPFPRAAYTESPSRTHCNTRQSIGIVSACHVAAFQNLDFRRLTIHPFTLTVIVFEKDPIPLSLFACDNPWMIFVIT
jgi:hypothetical protein